ncbi:hypothetical protein GNI_144240 [Gregarina niphandrodes]|uniref:Rho-GAP domain-containing protein n=1 Tax=Gregarina niphandrodes TaxID=110365 RepID=A0A023AZX0_GRENI|nr:hypothetical protein GNI_144240 [Gregarina niphandrodes]EZG44742.1 hypothetical protein GNI_144240 [Gregarina niphandrodes]|eukprot:XP_011134126.1 hypothetical protein GNI_144240 [Gregarina niphandrodes]
MVKDAAFSWAKAHPQVLADMDVITDCIERNQQIPCSCSIEAALRVLEKWLLTMPLPLVPNESLVASQTEEDKLHILCRAVLLNLPSLARNILMTMLAIMRELLFYNRMTYEIMLPLVWKDNPEELHNDGIMLSPIEFIPREVRDHLVSNLVRGHTKIIYGSDGCCRALAVWIARLVARDSPTEIRTAFVQHFLL